MRRGVQEAQAQRRHRPRGRRPPRARAPGQAHVPTLRRRAAAGGLLRGQGQDGRRRARLRRAPAGEQASAGAAGLGHTEAVRAGARHDRPRRQRRRRRVWVEDRLRRPDLQDRGGSGLHGVRRRRPRDDAPAQRAVPSRPDPSPADSPAAHAPTESRRAEDPAGQDRSGHPAAQGLGQARRDDDAHAPARARGARRGRPPARGEVPARGVRRGVLAARLADGRRLPRHADRGAAPGGARPQLHAGAHQPDGRRLHPQAGARLLEGGPSGSGDAAVQHVVRLRRPALPLRCPDPRDLPHARLAQGRRALPR